MSKFPKPQKALLRRTELFVTDSQHRKIPAGKSPQKKRMNFESWKFPLQNLAAHRSRVLGWTYPFTWAPITLDLYAAARRDQNIHHELGNNEVEDWWPLTGRESPIGKRKLIFPSLKVDMLVLMVSTFWVVSFFHSVSTSTYHSPSWTWNPEKKNHTFQVRNLKGSFL